MVETHPSVAVVIYHKDLKALLLVRQFRPAVIPDIKSSHTVATNSVCSFLMMSSEPKDTPHAQSLDLSCMIIYIYPCCVSNSTPSVFVGICSASERG
jgi:hypothetical protein